MCVLMLQERPRQVEEPREEEAKSEAQTKKIKSFCLDVSTTNICGIKESRDERVNEPTEATEMGNLQGLDPHPASTTSVSSPVDCATAYLPFGRHLED